MRLYNSLTRKVEEVKPADGRTVKMYTCGPTVYRYAHLGNFRTFMLGDLIRRALRFESQDVRWVMNITDVGHMTDEVTDSGRDRMELAEADEGLSAWEIAEKYTKAFLEDADALNIERADVYPKATDHIPEMIELTRRLIDGGHAYEVGGNVYFDVRSFSDYGKLSGNTLEALRAGHRQDLELDPNKRHHADFALWKTAGPGRVMKWDSPWGEGFPGWHIECSAMSMKYLGERFDIHTGGNDLKFPHHEDEIAQSESAVGHPVVSIWVHGGFLQQSGQKIAKSAKNVVLVVDLWAVGDPLAFRYLMFQSRYRSEANFTWDAFQQAQFKLQQLRNRMVEWKDEPRPISPSPQGAASDRAFRMAVADDLDMPQALVVLNEAVSDWHVPGGEKYTLVASWDRILGLDVERDAKQGYNIPDEIRDQARARDKARADGNFQEADNIRANVRSLGWELMDTPEGTKIRPLA